METQKIEEILETPLGNAYSASVEVVLLSKDFKKTCLVLQKPGKKYNEDFEYTRTQIWTNPGGSVKIGEKPIDAAKRESSTETGIPKKRIKILRFIEGKAVGTIENTHIKIVLLAMVDKDHEIYPFNNDEKDTLAREWVTISGIIDLKEIEAEYIDQNGKKQRGTFPVPQYTKNFVLAEKMPELT